LVAIFRYMSKKDSKLLIEVLLKTIDRVGIKKTIESLEITEVHITENQVLQEIIVKETCKEFGINKRTLVLGRKNNPSRTNAIGVCCVLVSRLCKISQSDIGKLLRKDVSNVNKYIKKCENLDTKFKEDKDILLKMQKIENNVHTHLANKLNI
jgi:hypothetical protein